MPRIKIEELNIEDTQDQQQSESDDEELPVEDPQIEESPTLPRPKRRSKKQQESVACPQCNKSMLLKTFRSYHSYQCKPAVPQPTVVEQTAPEKKQIEVAFSADFNRKDQINDNRKIGI